MAKTLVLGASSKPERYAYQAMNLLQQYDHEVIGISNRAFELSGVEIFEGLPAINDIDTITIYLSEKNQINYHDYILSLKPKRIIFNPGAENKILQKAASENGITTLNACTLVLLRTNQY